MLLSMNVSSMAVRYGVTRQTIRSWVNELKSGSLGGSIPLQLRDWVHHMCVNPRQRSEKGSGVMSMSVTDLAAEYGVTESTWLKAISHPATESVDIPASMLDEIADQDFVVELARSFKVTERYVRKRIADRNRANFLDSGDVDLSDEEIAAKYEYPHCICCECAVFLFECDVQWVNQFSMSHPYSAPNLVDPLFEFLPFLCVFTIFS